MRYLNGAVVVLTLFALLIPILLVSPAEGSSLHSGDLTELSSNIVVGRVDSIESRWDDQKTFIYSYARIFVEESLKGALKNNWIVVRYMGGVVDGVGLWGSSEPSFWVGQRAKLYLKSEGAGGFTVVHGWQGQFTLDEKSATPKWYDWPGWKWFTLPVQYYINNLVPADRNAAVKAGAQTWENDDASYWDLTYMGTTTREAPGLTPVSDGYQVVSWGPIDGAGGTLAVTWTWYEVTGEITETDIRFDSAESWSTTGEPGKFDVESIAVHEFGHWILLKDLYGLDDKEETMYGYASPGETKKRTLYTGDKAGIRIVYPYSTAPRTSMATDKSAYTRGETIYYCVVATNPTGTTYSNSRLVIKVVFPSGSKTTIFDSGTFTLQPRWGGAKFWIRVIPTSVSPGSYQFEDTLTYSGTTYTYTLPFTLT